MAARPVSENLPCVGRESARDAGLLRPSRRGDLFGPCRAVLHTGSSSLVRPREDDRFTVVGSMHSLRVAVLPRFRRGVNVRAWMGETLCGGSSLLSWLASSRGALLPSPALPSP